MFDHLGTNTYSIHCDIANPGHIYICVVDTDVSDKSIVSFRRKVTSVFEYDRTRFFEFCTPKPIVFDYHWRTV